MDPKAKLIAALMAKDPGMSPDLAARLAENLLKPDGARDAYSRIIGGPIDAAPAPSTPLPPAPPEPSVDQMLAKKQEQYKRFGVAPDQMQAWLQRDKQRYSDFEQQKRRARVEHYEKLKAKAANGEPLAEEESAWMRIVHKKQPAMQAAEKLAKPGVQPIGNGLTPSLPQNADLGRFGGMPGSRMLSDSPQTGRLFVPDHPAHVMPAAPQTPSNVIQMTPDDERQVIDETGRPASHYPVAVDGLGRLPQSQITPMRTGVYGHDQAVQDVLAGGQEGTSKYIEQAMERDFGTHLDAFQQNGNAWPENYFLGHDDEAGRVRRGADYLKILRAMRSRSSDI